MAIKNFIISFLISLLGVMIIWQEKIVEFDKPAQAQQIENEAPEISPNDHGVNITETKAHAGQADLERDKIQQALTIKLSYLESSLMLETAIRKFYMREYEESKAIFREIIGIGFLKDSHDIIAQICEIIDKNLQNPHQIIFPKQGSMFYWIKNIFKIEAKEEDISKTDKVDMLIKVLINKYHDALKEKGLIIHE